MNYDFNPVYLWNLEQGSDAWFKTKMGIISASKSKTIFAKATVPMKWGVGARTYLEALAMEYITRERKSVKAKALAWGNYYEDEARILYEEVTGYKVDQVGFIQMTDLIGSSPDGCVNSDGMIEIKCPMKTEIFYKYAADIKAHRIPKVHMPQCFHNIFVGKRDWCDFIAYNPRLVGYNRIKIVRADLDEMKSFCTPDTFYETILLFQDDLRKRINELKEIKGNAEVEEDLFKGCNFE